MSSRNIAVQEEVYNQLDRLKRPGESFTMVISRLIRDGRSPSRHFGAWAGMSEEEKEELERARKELRENLRMRDLDV